MCTDLHQKLHRAYCEHLGPRVCILGVYGKGNLGDEALLDTVSEDFASVFRNASFMVICSDADSVESDYEMLAFNRKPIINFIKKIKALSRADLCVVGGGTLIYDQASWAKNIAAIIALCYWPFWAWILGIPTVAYAQGLGPAKSPITKLTIKYILPMFSLVTLRDRASYDLYRYIVGDNNSKNLYVTCDSVIGSDKYVIDRTTITDIQHQNLLDKIPYVVVAFREPQAASAHFVDDWSRLICQCQKHTDTRLVLLPIQLSKKYSDDNAILDKVAEILETCGIQKDRIIRINWKKLEEAAWILQNAKVVVSNRLHALLLALKAGVPVVGIGGTDKIKGCLNMVGMQNACSFIDQDNFNEDTAFEKFVVAYNATTEEKTKLIEDVANWVNKKPTNTEIINQNFGYIREKYF